MERMPSMDGWIDICMQSIHRRRNRSDGSMKCMTISIYIYIYDADMINKVNEGGAK